MEHLRYLDGEGIFAPLFGRSRQQVLSTWESFIVGEGALQRPESFADCVCLELDYRGRASQR